MMCDFCSGKGFTKGKSKVFCEFCNGTGEVL